MWDRSKQKHWINTHGEVWEVLDFKTNEHVCIIPAMYDAELHKKICFLKNIDEIKKLCEESFIEYDEIKKKFPDFSRKSNNKH